MAGNHRTQGIQRGTMDKEYWDSRSKCHEVSIDCYIWRLESVLNDSTIGISLLPHIVHIPLKQQPVRGGRSRRACKVFLNVTAGQITGCKHALQCGEGGYLVQ